MVLDHLVLMVVVDPRDSLVCKEMMANRYKVDYVYSTHTSDGFILLHRVLVDHLVMMEKMAAKAQL